MFNNRSHRSGPRENVNKAADEVFTLIEEIFSRFITIVARPDGGDESRSKGPENLDELVRKRD